MKGYNDNKGQKSHKLNKAKMMLTSFLLNLDQLGINQDDVYEVIIATVKDIYGKKLKEVNIPNKKLTKSCAKSYGDGSYMAGLIKKKESG